jgi:hypothetical protein
MREMDLIGLVIRFLVGLANPFMTHPTSTRCETKRDKKLVEYDKPQIWMFTKNIQFWIQLQLQSRDIKKKQYFFCR